MPCMASTQALQWLLELCGVGSRSFIQGTVHASRHGADCFWHVSAWNAMTKGRGNIALPSRRLATNCRPPQYSMPAKHASVVFSAPLLQLWRHLWDLHGHGAKVQGSQGRA